MSVFQGARTSAPTTTIATDITTLIEWSVEDFDSGEWFDPLASTEYVVPAGVTALVATVGVGFPSNGNGFRDVQIYHQSGTSVITRAHARQDAADSGKTILTATTGPLAVVAGDKLLAVVKQTSGGDMLLTSDTHGSFFSVEEVTEGEAGVSIEDHDLLENRVTVNEDDLQSQDIRITDLEDYDKVAKDIVGENLESDWGSEGGNQIDDDAAPPGLLFAWQVMTGFSTVAAHRDIVEDRLTSINEDVAALEARITELENAPAPVADTSALEAQVAALEAQSAADAVTIAALVARVDTHLAP